MTEMAVHLLVALLIGLILGFLLGKIMNGGKSAEKPKKEKQSKKETTNKTAPAQIADDDDDTAIIDLDTPLNLDGSDYGIETLQGVGPQTGDLLRGYGIKTVGDYLRKMHSPSLREEAAKSLDILVQPLHNWASMADLLRIEGVDQQYAELLFSADILTVSDLSHSDPDELTPRLEEANSDGKQLIAPNAPDINQVNDWIARAGSMSPVVTI
jgi:predicted flap endonuclease-1-like 5' DNA nuclease